jgi:hypothetical protein
MLQGNQLPTSPALQHFPLQRSCTVWSSRRRLYLWNNLLLERRSVLYGNVCRVFWTYPSVAIYLRYYVYGLLRTCYFIFGLHSWNFCFLFSTVDINFVSRRSFTATLAMGINHISFLHTITFHNVLLIQFSEPFRFDNVERSDGNVQGHASLPPCFLFFRMKV